MARASVPLDRKHSFGDGWVRVGSFTARGPVQVSWTLAAATTADDYPIEVQFRADDVVISSSTFFAFEGLVDIYVRSTNARGTVDLESVFVDHDPPPEWPHETRFGGWAKRAGSWVKT